MPTLIPMSWAVAVSVATDFLAYLPTFDDAWRRPGEEAGWVPYAMFGAAAARGPAGHGLPDPRRRDLPEPPFAADVAMVIMILASPHYAAPLPSAGRSRAPPEPPMRLSVTSAQWRPVTGKDWRQPDLAGGSGGRLFPGSGGWVPPGEKEPAVSSGVPQRARGGYR